MGKMDDLFDGSDAHELCSACHGTRRVYEGERCRFCEDSEPFPKRKELLDECDELREIAAWIDSLGKRDNAAFLRKIAARLEGGDNMSPTCDQAPNAALTRGAKEGEEADHGTTSR